MIWVAVLLLALSVDANIGPSGIVSPDGKNIQFSHDFANNIVLIGPSGIVTRDGKNLQLTEGQARLNLASFRSAPSPTPIAQYLTQRGVVGASGIVRPDGRNIQFTHEQANNIVLIGPSGIVTRNGQNIQFTDDLKLARKRRSVGYVSKAGNVGTSGILRADGTTTLFDHDLAHNILLVGPSGIVTKDGRNIQFTSDLNIVPRASKSADPAPPLLKGSSGMILSSGQPVQFKSANPYIVLEGPSGIIMSDGTLVQKWHQ